MIQTKESTSEMFLINLNAFDWCRYNVKHTLTCQLIISNILIINNL